MNAEGKAGISRRWVEISSGTALKLRLWMGEGLLPVRWQGQPLCRVTAEGSVRYTPGEIKGDAGNETICHVADIAKITSEYIALLETVPPAQGQRAWRWHRLLAEFNGTVLAAQPTKYGVHFATWERDFDKTGLCWGHYFEDCGKARQDFATRSGLVAEKNSFPRNSSRRSAAPSMKLWTANFPLPRSESGS